MREHYFSYFWFILHVTQAANVWRWKVEENYYVESLPARTNGTVNINGSDSEYKMHGYQKSKLKR